MKKIIIVVLLIIALFVGHFESNGQDLKPLNTEKVVNDLDTIKGQIDTAYNTGKEIVNLLSKEVKMYGLKKTLQINMGLFLPIFIFIILYLVWLKGRKTKK